MPAESSGDMTAHRRLAARQFSCCVAGEARSFARDIDERPQSKVHAAMDWRLVTPEPSQSVSSPELMLVEWGPAIAWAAALIGVGQRRHGRLGRTRDPRFRSL